ncbi:MAG: hypothetical protein AAFP88_03165 [Bacteroidota bacterium]
MSAVVGCNTNNGKHNKTNEKQNKTKAQLIAEAESLIDRMSIEDLKKVPPGISSQENSIEIIRKKMKEEMRSMIASLEEDAKINIQEVKARIAESKRRSASLQLHGKPKELTNVIYRVTEKIIEESSQ